MPGKMDTPTLLCTTLCLNTRFTADVLPSTKVHAGVTLAVTRVPRLPDKGFGVAAASVESTEWHENDFRKPFRRAPPGPTVRRFGTRDYMRAADTAHFPVRGTVHLHGIIFPAVIGNLAQDGHPLYS